MGSQVYTSTHRYFGLLVSLLSTIFPGVPCDVLAGRLRDSVGQLLGRVTSQVSQDRQARSGR